MREESAIDGVLDSSAPMLDRMFSRTVVAVTFTESGSDEYGDTQRVIDRAVEVDVQLDQSVEDAVQGEPTGAYETADCVIFTSEDNLGLFVDGSREDGRPYPSEVYDPAMDEWYRLDTVDRFSDGEVRCAASRLPESHDREVGL